MSPAPSPRTRVVVALTGATGIVYGVRLLEVLGALPGIETHLVISSPAKRTRAMKAMRVFAGDTW